MLSCAFLLAMHKFHYIVRGSFYVINLSDTNMF